MKLFAFSLLALTSVSAWAAAPSYRCGMPLYQDGTKVYAENPAFSLNDGLTAFFSSTSDANAVCQYCQWGTKAFNVTTDPTDSRDNLAHNVEMDQYGHVTSITRAGPNDNHIFSMVCDR